MKSSVLIALFILLTPFNLSAQEEFIVGKSANSLKKGFTIISAEYSAYAFENIKARRAGLDISYGLSDRFSLSLRGSLSDFSAPGLEFETGTITALYQIINSDLNANNWTVASFFQGSLISNTAQIPADINFEGNNTGFSLGAVVNRNMESLTLSATVAYAKIALPKFIDGLLDGYGILYQISANKTLNTIDAQRNFKIGLIAELIGQYNSSIGTDQGDIFGSGSYLDGLAGMQFTAANTYRLELALQTQLTGKVVRFTESLYHIRLKYML